MIMFRKMIYRTNGSEQTEKYGYEIMAIITAAYK